MEAANGRQEELNMVDLESHDRHVALKDGQGHPICFMVLNCQY